MTLQLYDLVGSDRSRPFSPHCWKAKMALAHKGLPVETIPTTFTDIPTVEEGAVKTVPALRDAATLVVDSVRIAEYLEDAYPDRPSLFEGEGGRALTRFVESWTLRVVQPYIGKSIILDIHGQLDEPDGDYLRRTREVRFGDTLENLHARREEGLAAFRQSLEPMRAIVDRQAFLGGDRPLFADYILFGTFQWPRIISAFPLLEEGDPVHRWFERCLDLHGGLGRTIFPAGA